MLDRLFLKYLSKQGKVAYFVGQILLFALWAYILLVPMDYSMEDGKPLFVIGMIVILVVWGGVCLGFWRDKTAKKDN